MGVDVALFFGLAALDEMVVVGGFLVLSEKAEFAVEAEKFFEPHVAPFAVLDELGGGELGVEGKSVRFAFADFEGCARPGEEAFG